MRYLLISILFCVVSCTSYIKKNNYTNVAVDSQLVKNAYFSNQEKDYVYKAKINVYNNYFGGVFIVKKIADSNHRIVFTTEMGAKIFDFSFYKDEFKVNYIIDELNKKILLNVLEKDFRVLVRESQQVISKSEKHGVHILETKINNKTYFYKLLNNDVLKSIVRVNNGKEKVQFLFLNIHEATAKNIQILHSNIKLDINLKSIN
mgnify:FL=1